jgi:hypothetical protein
MQKEESNHNFVKLTRDDDHIDRVRLYLRNAATNGSIVHPPGDIWAWRTIVEWDQKGKTPDLSTRALWQSYKSPTSKARGTGEENHEFGLAQYICSYFKGIFNMQ